MKLTPEARDAMLGRYRNGEKPGPLAREYGIRPASLHRYRELAGIPSHRGMSPALAKLEAQCAGALLPVYPVRLVSRPAARPGYDHDFEPGAYGVCRRCGEEKHGPAGSARRGGDDGRS